MYGLNYTTTEEFYSDMERYGEIVRPQYPFKDKKKFERNQRRLKSESNREKAKRQEATPKESQELINKRLKDPRGSLNRKHSESRGIAMIDTNFTISIADQRFDEINDSTYEYEFDVYGKCSVSNLYFEGTLVLLEYNTSALGTDISANTDADVTLFKGPLFLLDTNMKVSHIDDSDSVLAMNMLNYNVTSPSPIQMPGNSDFLMFTVIIKVKKSACNSEPLQAFYDVPRMQIINWYSKGTTDIKNYDFLFTEGPDPFTLCPYPVISTSLSSLGTVRAGMNQVIDIRGKNFGDTRGDGKLLFTDSDKNTFSPNQILPVAFPNLGQCLSRQIEV